MQFLGDKSTRSLKIHRFATISSIEIRQIPFRCKCPRYVALSSFAVSAALEDTRPTIRTSQSTIIRTIDITCLCPRRHFSLRQDERAAGRLATCLRFSLALSSIFLFVYAC